MRLRLQVALLCAALCSSIFGATVPQLHLLPLGEVTQETADGLADLIDYHIDMGELLSSSSLTPHKISKWARLATDSTFLSQKHEMDVTDIQHSADIHDLKGREFIKIFVVIKSADHRQIYNIEIMAFYKKVPRHFGKPVYSKKKPGKQIMKLDQIEGFVR